MDNPCICVVAKVISYNYLSDLKVKISTLYFVCIKQKLHTYICIVLCNCLLNLCSWYVDCLKVIESEGDIPLVPATINDDDAHTAVTKPQQSLSSSTNNQPTTLNTGMSSSTNNQPTTLNTGMYH